MGLRIKQPWWLKTQGIVTLIAVFALAIQPVGGFVSGLVANAVSSSVDLTYFQTMDKTSQTDARHIQFGMHFTDINDAKALDVHILRGDGSEIVKSMKAENIDVYVNGSTGTTGYIFTKEVPGNFKYDSYTASNSSWERAKYANGTSGYVQWTNATAPIKAWAVVTNNDNSTITSPEYNFQTTSLLYTYPVLSDSNVRADAYYSSGSGYTSISVDPKLTDINTATDVELCVDNGDGVTFGDHCIHAKPGVLDSLNRSNIVAGGVKTTGPVIMKGSRTSSSWTNQTGTWNSSSRPSKARVVVTLQDGTKLTAYDDTIVSNGTPLNTEATVFADIDAPTATLEVKGGQVVDGKRYVRPGDTIKYTVVASDTESGLDKAPHIVTKLAPNGTSQIGLVCGGWGGSYFATGSDTFTGSFKMRNCNNPAKGNYGSTDGLYGIGFRVYDKAGNNVRIPNSVYTVDGTDPVADDFRIDNPASTYRKEIKVSAVITEDNLKDVTFYVTQAESTNADGSLKCTGSSAKIVTAAGVLNGGRYEATLDTSSLTGDNYCVNVTASDFAKNNATPRGRQLVAIDNTAPKVMGVELDKIISFGDANFTSLGISDNRLAVTFTTNEPLKITASQVSLRVPGVSNAAPSTGWTSVQEIGDNKYLANVSLVDSTDSSTNPNWENFFVGKVYEDVSLYFRLFDELDNHKNTYYAIDPETAKPIDGWTTNSGDQRNYKFTIDNKAPVVTITHSNDKITTDSDGVVDDIKSYKVSQYVQVEVDEDNLGTTSVYRSGDNTEVQSHTGNDNFALTKGLSEGKYYLVHIDQAGNESNKVEFVIDRTSPKIEEVSRSDAYSNSPDVAKSKNFSFKVSDNGGSELTKVRIAVNKYHSTNSNNRGDQIYNDYDVKMDADGRYTLDVESLIRDQNLQHGDKYVILYQAGNIAGNHGTKYDQFTVDNVNPTASISGLENRTVQTGVSPKLKATVDGTGSKATSVQYRVLDSSKNKIKGFGWVDVNVIDGEKIEADIQTDGLVDGSYTVRLRVFDEAGNKKSGYDSTFTVDNVAPSAPQITPNNLTVAKGSSFKIAITPANAGDNINSSSVEDSQGNVYTGDSNHVYTIDTTILPKGTKINVTGTSKDAAGNISAAKNVTYTVDNGAPSVDIVSLSDNGEGIFTLSGTSGFTDGASVVVSSNGSVVPGNHYTRADGSWSVVVGELAAETAYTFNVTISNALGYFNDPPAVFNFITDPVRGSSVDGVSTASAVFIPGETENVEIAGDETPEPTVLGSEDSRVQGDSTAKNTAAITPSEEGWKLFGTAWYWWLAALAAIIGFFWWLAGVIRRRQTQEA